MKPWALALVLAVGSFGPMIGRLELFASSRVNNWRRSQWIGLAVAFAAVLLAVTGSASGRIALILATLPLIWVITTDRSILKGKKEPDHRRVRDPLAPFSAGSNKINIQETQNNQATEAPSGAAHKQLTGSELLDKIKELGDSNKSELVRACGYFSVKNDGSERLNFTAFYEALLTAKGVSLTPVRTQEATELSYTVLVQDNGDISIEKTYMDLLGIRPGDEFEIKLGRKQIRLIPLGVDNEEDDQEEQSGEAAEWEDLDESTIVNRLCNSNDIDIDVLANLSTSESWAVRQAVAWHDNTPNNVIEALAKDDDPDVRRATKERSLPMEWRIKSKDEKISALQSAVVSIGILEELSTSEDWPIRQAVAWSPSTPESILARLKEDEDVDVKAAATEERKLTVEWRFLKSWEKVERLNAESVTTDVLIILSRSRSSDVRRAIALNPNTPKMVLAQLAKDDDRDVQSGVRERQLPENWKDRDNEERVEALKEEGVPENVISILAQSGDWQIRQAVALSPASSARVLERLANDDDTDVQSAVRERDLPEDWKYLDNDEKVERIDNDEAALQVLEILASSSNWEVRQAVSKNCRTPQSALETLARDRDDDVSSAAKETLQQQLIPIDWSELEESEVVQRLESQQITSPNILRGLSYSEEWEVRQAVARNASTPDAVLQDLVKDHDDDVRSAARQAIFAKYLPAEWAQLESSEVARRLKTLPETNAETLRALSASDDWEVRQAVAWHNNTPSDVIAALAEDDDSDVRQATQDRSLPMEWRTKSEDEKVSVLQSADVAVEIIKELAASESWSLRQAVAWSPSTPESILATLKEDRDDDVKAAANDERRLPVEWRFLDAWQKVERLQAETLSVEILTILSRSRSSDVRRAVALNANTPETVIAQLSHDDDRYVQSGVRERLLPDTWKVRDDEERIKALKDNVVPEDVLSILSQSGNWQVRRAVAFSPSASASILERLSRDSDRSVQSAVRERNLPADWRHLDGEEKVEKLNKSSATQDVLEILAKSGNWEVRQAVAANEGTSEELLKELLNDDDPDVIRAAKKSLRRIGGGNSIADAEELDEDEEHSIYIKTEPGGSIRFGVLDSDQIEMLHGCIDAQELTEELREIGDNSSGQLNECDGVVNSGDEGDFGNEGNIVYSSDQRALGPDLNDDDSFKDGVYVVLMRLSKCSVSFEFMASGGFDEDEFEEVSVPVRLPEEIVHGLYGHPDFNIITGFRFRGEPIEEYEGEVDDRGYDDQLTFFVIQEGVTTILYSNYNGEEEWCDAEMAKIILSAFL